MSRTRHVSALVASCLFAAVCGMNALAADLSIPSTSQVRKSGKPAERSSARQYGHNGNKGHMAHNAQSDALRSADRDRHGRIVTYSLLRDPLLRVYAADKRQADTTARTNILGTGFGANVSPLPVPPANALRPEANANGNPGLAFGCREKPFGATTLRRELTACFRHDVDRSWKAHTYLSRGFAEGSQNWGGGLSVAYAY